MNAAPPARPDSILDFWLGAAAGDPLAARERASIWYGGSPDLDREITTRFGTWIDAAAAGAHDAWRATPRHRLALVILLDQLPRNVHRGTARAFAYDARALEVAQEGVAGGHLEALRPVEQVFLLMPYQHVEDLSLQRAGVALYERVERAAPPEWRPLLANTLDFARRHLAVVERFGRFPHRNAALGRVTTAAERAYLSDGGERFGS
jgi:uncharacterized protein (DUF924 family)